MTGTAADYTWFERECPELLDGCSISLVRGLSTEDTLRRLNAHGRQVVEGLEGLQQFEYDVDYDGQHAPVGVATIADWSLVVEVGWLLGGAEPVLVELSRGTRVVSHFRGLDGEDGFFWVEDGDIRVNFEPLFPNGRSGSTPDALVGQMRRVGFRLSEADDGDVHLHTEATFALAEHLTGVRLTPHLLRGSTYLCSIASIPRS